MSGVATYLRRMTGRPWIILAVAAGCTAAVASFTHPFTMGADIVTAIPLVIGFLVVVRRVISKRYSPAAPQAEVSPAGREPLTRWALVWLALLVTVAGWEAYSFLSAPRSQHPTLSTLIDLLDSTQAGRGFAFLLWLALGWYLVTR